ncbi:Histone-lysine N-methyltransferase, H3 lysine-9 specific [Leucoagaricus sp. SymC.cos]|nr:Histone-lysine N-methyltransferase, H3 lysine-9 specific [Leucoagaricus sp. SymC.cos]
MLKIFKSRSNLDDPELLRKRLFEHSPSPELDEERGEQDKEWSYEVVGEEVSGNGDVRFEIDWDNWTRPNGTTQSWHRMAPSVTREWQRIQNRRRKALAQDSIDIELDKLAGTDIHNFATCLRAQAYEEKLKARMSYKPTLEDDMHKLLLEKQDPEWESLATLSFSSSRIPDTPGQARRALRVSTIRQQRSPETSRKSTPNKPPSTAASTSSSSTSTSTQQPPQAGPSRPRALLPMRQELEAQSLGSQTASTSSNRDGNPSHKRKISEVEDTETEPSREDYEASISSGKGKAPMHSIRPRIKLSTQWARIAQLAGAAPISFVNEVDNEEIPPLVPDFQYIEKGYKYHKGTQKPSSDFQIGCSLNKRGDKVFAYTKSGLFSFTANPSTEVIECNSVCKCGPNCNNRIAQRPRDVPLQIFKTQGKGWGVRASVDIIRGKILGVYTGELITREEALNRDTSYMFDLDGQENLRDRDDEDAGLDGKFSVDSRTCGNWTHFVNHSCGPNMKIYLVVYETIPGTNQPYVAFVAREAITAGTELTVDYDPAHADESAADYSEGMGMKKCFCGSEKCRDWVQMV